MPTKRPEAGSDKTAVKGCAGMFILRGNFGGLVV